MRAGQRNERAAEVGVEAEDMGEWAVVLVGSLVDAVEAAENTERSSSSSLLPLSCRRCCNGTLAKRVGGT